MPSDRPAASVAAPLPPERSDAPSDPYRAYLRKQRFNRWRVRISQIALLGIFLIIWEVAPREYWVNPMLTSYPSAIWPSFLDLLAHGNLIHHTLVTLLETVVSFMLSMTLGIAVAIALWWWPLVYRVLDPYFVVLNALPKIALVPIFYLWLGAQLSIYGIAVAIGVFTTILMMYSGFAQADPNKVKLIRSFGGSRRQILQKVVLPSSVPAMMAALKVNVGLALVGVIVGEFQSAKAGLGYLIVYGSQIFQMDMVMVAVTILAVISLVMYSLVYLIEAAIARRRS